MFSNFSMFQQRHQHHSKQGVEHRAEHSQENGVMEVTGNYVRRIFSDCSLLESKCLRRLCKFQQLFF